MHVLLLVSELLRPAGSLHIDDTRSALPNFSCGMIVDGSHCLCKSSFISNLCFQRDHFFLKVCDNLFSRRDAITPIWTQAAYPQLGRNNSKLRTRMRNQSSSCSSSDKSTVATVGRMTIDREPHSRPSARQRMWIRTETTLGQNNRTEGLLCQYVHHACTEPGKRHRRGRKKWRKGCAK